MRRKTAGECHTQLDDGERARKEAVRSRMRPTVAVDMERGLAAGPNEMDVALRDRLRGGPAASYFPRVAAWTIAASMARARASGADAAAPSCAVSLRPR